MHSRGILRRLFFSHCIVCAGSGPLAPGLDKLARLLERVALRRDHFPTDRQCDLLSLHGLSLRAVSRARSLSLCLLDRGLKHLDLLAHFALRRLVVEAAEHLLELSQVNRGLLVLSGIFIRVLAL